MLGEDKKVDENLMEPDRFDVPEQQTGEQPKDNKKRNIIIGVSITLVAIVGLIIALTAGESKSAAKEALWHKQLQCVPKSQPVWTIEQTCSFSVDRFTKGQEIDINSDKFKCTVGSDGLYSDPSFPATITGMIYWDKLHFDPEVEAIKKKYGFVFKRPTELPVDKGGGKSPSLWGSKGVLPLAPVQGDVGDCWFLSSLSAIAETPSRIKSLFENTEYPKNGAFQIYFWIAGKKQKVIIDDRLPAVKLFQKEKNGLYASRAPPSGAWWSVIIEKAAAKLFANYQGLSSGATESALRFLTGMPTSHYSSKELIAAGGDAFVWKIIMKGTVNNWPMTTGTSNPAKDYLMPNHAYTVLKGIQLKNPNGSDGPKLIQIRNPHGSSRYNNRGPWSSRSNKWTADFKKQTGYTGSETQGVFWFPLDLFTEDWSGLTLAHWNDNYKVSNMQGDTKMFASNTKSWQSTQYITISNPVVQDVYISCEQLLWRMFPRGLKNYCPELPSNFFFNVYTEYVQYGQNVGQGSTLWNPQQENKMCIGNAMLLESLPVGKFMIPVRNYNDSKGKDSSFTLTAMAEQSKVTLATQKSYQM